MNAAGTGSEGNLPSFYGYRNTFNKNHTWVKIPEQVTFVHTTNPYVDDLHVDPTLNAEAQSTLGGPRADWGPDAAYRPSTSEFAAHSLEHLAAAASDQYPYNAQTSGAGHSMVSTAPHYTPYHSQDVAPASATSRRAMFSNASPTASYPSSNNLSSILNHSHTLSPVIDPSLQSAIQRQPTGLESAVTENVSKQTEKREGRVQDDHQMAALLRGIAEEHPAQRHEGTLGANG